MINLPASQLSTKWTKREIENSKKYRAEQAKKAKNERIQKLTNDIEFCNNHIGDSNFINEATPENLKALLLFRLQLISEKNILIGNVK